VVKKRVKGIAVASLLTATFTGKEGWEKRRRGDKERRRKGRNLVIGRFGDWAIGRLGDVIWNVELGTWNFILYRVFCKNSQNEKG